MRTFYIFKIDNEYYNLTKSMPYNLYKTLLNIKIGTKDNLKYLKLFLHFGRYMDTLQSFLFQPNNKFLLFQLN